MNEKNNNLTLLILGIAMGAGAAYLFTTKEGKILKEKLIKEGKKLLEELGEGIEEAGVKLEDVKDSAQDKLTEGAEQVREKVEEVVNEVPGQVEQIKRKSRRFFFKRHASKES